MNKIVIQSVRSCYFLHILMFAKWLGHIIMFMKYHFVVRFTIGHVYDKVKDKQILLNYLRYTSLGSLFH